MDNTVETTLASASSNEVKTKKLANVTKKQAINGKVNADDYAVVTGYLLKDYVAVYGSIRAQKMLPEILGEFLNTVFSNRAKQIKKSIAVRKVLAANRSEIENASR
jgi:hypothetical protein